MQDETGLKNEADFRFFQSVSLDQFVAFPNSKTIYTLRRLTEITGERKGSKKKRYARASFSCTAEWAQGQNMSVNSRPARIDVISGFREGRELLGGFLAISYIIVSYLSFSRGIISLGIFGD